MIKFIKVIDIADNEHVVNLGYIVQLHTRKLAEWDNRGHKVRDYIGYFINVANAGVACFNAEDIQVDEHTYSRVLELI